jgi:endonuclease YncB( thermonuclease family)
MIKSAALLVLCLNVSAVETKPVPVLRVVDGDTIEVAANLGGFTAPVRVRLQFVDTPEASDNDHGKAMKEGIQAKEFLTDLLPVGSLVELHVAGNTLQTDDYGRVLAIVNMQLDENGKPRRSIPTTSEVTIATIACANEEIIKAGWSPYWMKYGLAPDRYDASFRLAQDQADKAEAGAWKTNSAWIHNKANERSAPKKTRTAR